MIKVNFKDGNTLEFNLHKEDDFNQWLEWSQVADFQNKITGVGILFDKRLIMLPLPTRFKRIRFSAELVYKTRKGKNRLVGEKLTCHADDTLLELLTFTGVQRPTMDSKLTMRKIGKQMFKNFNYKGLENVSK